MTRAERYAYRRRWRRCVDCPNRTDRAQCDDCRSARAKRRRDRIAAKQCTRCQLPALEGFEHCAAHRASKNATNLRSFNRRARR